MQTSVPLLLPLLLRCNIQGHHIAHLHGWRWRWPAPACAPAVCHVLTSVAPTHPNRYMRLGSCMRHGRHGTGFRSTVQQSQDAKHTPLSSGSKQQGVMCSPGATAGGEHATTCCLPAQLWVQHHTRHARTATPASASPAADPQSRKVQPRKKTRTAA